MSRLLLVLLLPLALSACGEKTAGYYRTHPQQLAAAIEHCRATQSSVACTELETIAAFVKNMADNLRQDPQVFGQRILTLQEEMAAMKKPSHKMAQELHARLAVVKWLESPNS